MDKSNYLANRFQFVAVKGESSDRLPVVSGAPQGSITLHNAPGKVIYINNVATMISHDSKINMLRTIQLFMEHLSH